MRIVHVLLLALPMGFASIIFATGFRDGPGVDRVLSANLFGAICGGFAEYASVAIGFRGLYLVAIGFYLLSAAALVRAPLVRWVRVWHARRDLNHTTARVQC